MGKAILALFMLVLTASLFAVWDSSKKEPSCYVATTLQWKFDTLVTTLDALPVEKLEEMDLAGIEVMAWEKTLAKEQTNVVREILCQEEEFYQLVHYPHGDVIDRERGSHYYYHAHRAKEHGHFHLFLSTRFFSSKPALVSSLKKVHPHAHLIAISMDRYGKAKGLFTVNQWVTAGEWRSAEELTCFMEAFDIEVDSSSQATDRWLSAMVKLFSPQISALLEARDHQIANLPDRLMDRHWEVLSQMSICVDTQRRALQKVLEKKRSQRDRKSSSTIVEV